MKYLRLMEVLTLNVDFNLHPGWLHMWSEWGKCYLERGE